MPKLKVHLSIGFPSSHDDVIDVDDDEYESCKTDEKKEELLSSITKEWASNYIDIAYKMIN